MIAMQPRYPAEPVVDVDSEPVPSFDTRRLVRKLLWGLPVMLVAALLGAYGGVMSLRVIPPRYTSSVSILIDPKRPGSYGADTEFANAFVDTSKIADVELILLSSAVLGRVVDEEHLADNPAFGGASPSLLDHFLPALGGHVAPVTADTPELRRDRAIDTLRTMVKAARISVTYVVTVDVNGPTADAARRLASDIANAYLDEQLDAKNDAAARDSAWLNTRIQQQRDALTRSSAAVEELRRQLGVTSSDATQDYTVDRESIGDINKELSTAEADLAVAQSRYEQAAQVVRDGGGLDGLSQVTGSPVVSSLRNQQAIAAERLANLSVRYAADHPERRQAEQDLKALNHQVSLEVSRIIAGLKNDYQAALTHRNVLKEKLDGLVKTVNAATSAEGRTELREAERVVDADKVAYEGSLNRLRDVEQQQSRQDVEARIISGPDLPERPSFPKPMMVIPAGAFLGFLIGAGLAFIMPTRRNRVEDELDAERDLSLPMLASVPFVTPAMLQVAGETSTIPNYLLRNPFSFFGESFRLLRLRLSKAGPMGNQVVQITSSVQGEGKSTVAACLAMSAALSGIKTVLVDLDFHHPESGRLLEFKDSTGVVDILTGSVATSVALRTYKDLPLRAITAGSISSLHPAMIEGAQLRDLIDELRQEFDFIVLDTPPVLAICDPLFIANLVDATVMVIAWRATPQEFVTDAIRALKKMHAPLAGLLLNKVNFARTGKYKHSYYGERRYISA
jgi:capsular exopolysaccharide synthesis family protein